MIKIEPCVVPGGSVDGMLTRLRLLGFSRVGFVQNKFSQEFRSLASAAGFGTLEWKVEGKVSDFEIYQASNVGAKFKMLRVSLMADPTSFKKLANLDAGGYDAVGLSFPEVRRLFQEEPRQLFERLSDLRHHLSRRSSGLLPCSDATTPEGLVSPSAYEALLYIFYCRPEPLASAKLRRMTGKLEMVGVS
jgi:hypothetical protein